VDSSRPTSSSSSSSNSGRRSKSRRHRKKKSDLPCFAFQKGTCRRGDSCKYSHSISADNTTSRGADSAVHIASSSRETTSPADEEQIPIYAAVIENNAREVGIAILEKDTNILRLCQVADNRHFAFTLLHLDNAEAGIILYPHSHAKKRLASTLAQRYGESIASTAPRGTFNEIEGAKMLQKFSSDEVLARELTQRYLARAAAAALLHYAYTHLAEGLALRESTLRVKFDDLEGRLVMDTNTIRNLEVLKNRKDGRAEGSLLGILKGKRAGPNAAFNTSEQKRHRNFSTPMGLRMLRANLISPSADRATIEGRLDALEEVLAHPAVHQRLCGILRKFHDADRLTTFFSEDPKRHTLGLLRSEIDNVLRMRDNLRLIPEIRTILDGCLKAPLWRLVIQNLPLKPFDMLRVAIEKKVTERAAYSRKNVMQRMQQILCVKGDEDGLLDVARLTYGNVIQQMEALVSEYASQIGVPVALHYTKARGYHLKVTRIKGHAELPPFFVQRVESKKSVFCSTHDLGALNIRQEQSMGEIIQLTVLQLGYLRALITEPDNLRSLFKMGEAIALTDYILGLASFITNSPKQYVRPKFSGTDNGDTTPVFRMVGARHPVMELLASSRSAKRAAKVDTSSFVPNNCVFDKAERLKIIMGPNCAGKTVYLKTCALAVIMAQIGCYVPASADFTIPIFYQIFTRIGTEDSIEHNASSFSLEMAENAYILRSLLRGVDNRSSSQRGAALVVVDELGRGTSTKEGVAIAWATAEELTSPRVPDATYTLFVTHFSELAALAETSSKATLAKFQVSVDASDQRLALLFRLENESAQNREDAARNPYGINLASHCGMPKRVIEDAMKIRRELVKKLTRNTTLLATMNTA